MAPKDQADTLLRSAASGRRAGRRGGGDERERTTYEGAFGRRVLGQAAAMTPDTVVWIASMTKAVTGAGGDAAGRARQARARRPAAEVVPELGEARCWTASTPPASRDAARRSGRSRCGTCSPIPRASPTRSGEPIIAVPGGHGTARHHHLRECGARHAAAVRPGRALGVRHQHRLGGQDGRGGSGQKLGAYRRRTSSSRSACATPPSRSRRRCASAWPRSISAATTAARADRPRAAAGARVRDGRRRALRDRRATTRSSCA